MIPKFVSMCVRCGRGFVAAQANNIIDTMPVWWTQAEAGPVCNGRIMRVDRMAQIEKNYHEPILKPEEVHIV